jgi:hypothetical protein
VKFIFHPRLVAEFKMNEWSCAYNSLYAYMAVQLFRVMLLMLLAFISLFANVLCYCARKEPSITCVLLLLLLFITFMQSIYNYATEPNDFSRIYND